ncbi:MAG: hypothetical protein IJW24_03520 [Clostridia bacterium]|nr:hypothetical protein [Clostridia bacterium]
MSAIEIAIVCVIGGFAVISISRAIFVKIKAKGKSKGKEEKLKKSKEKAKAEGLDIADSKSEGKLKETPVDEKGFRITKKGVAKIQKKAIDRDPRTMAKIEPVYAKKEKSGGEYESFDDLLSKMKSVGDPDELDDETFRKMFMSGADQGVFDGDDLDEIPMSSNFRSLESPPSGKINRKLEHFTIDGKHLREQQNFQDFPNRKPMFNTNVEFTERITGRYANITMGDISNRLAPSEEQMKKQEEIKAANEESDEDIFAKIMERRRRELGLEPLNPREPADEKEVVITPETLVIADAIMNPRSKKNIKK